MRDLADMCGRSLRAASGPRDKGIHIRQITNAHVTIVMQYFHYHSNNTGMLNTTIASYCHTCLWGYKYKLLMQGVELVLTFCY